MTDTGTASGGHDPAASGHSAAQGLAAPGDRAGATTMTKDVAPLSGRRPPDALTLGLDHIVWALIVVFSLVTGLLNSFFLTTANLQNILIQATSLGLLVLAVSF